MTPRRFVDLALRPALHLLPAKMRALEAQALILAICLQESKLQHRRQKPHGKARGYAQFEPAGVTGVFKHPRTGELAVQFCYDLDVSPRTAAVHTALEFHDVLGVGFARLLIWTLPNRLPHQHDAEHAWIQYLEAWRPGKPRWDGWPDHYAAAWATILEPPPPLRAEPGAHHYLSTACQHGQHHDCRHVCKFCPAKCQCFCHRHAEATP